MFKKKDCTFEQNWVVVTAEEKIFVLTDGLTVQKFDQIMLEHHDLKVYYWNRYPFFPVGQRGLLRAHVVILDLLVNSF